MQRHLQTKHQIKREESPPIPYHPTTAPDGTTSSMLDIKPPPFLNYPYYAHPPWLGQVGQHDYHGYYQHQGRLTCSLHNFTKNEFQICVNFCNQYLAHVIEQPIFGIPNLEYLQEILFICLINSRARHSGIY